MDGVENMPIKVLSLFDGLGGARIALDQLGVPCEYYASEVDKHAIKVHTHHFPGTIQVGDVTKLKGKDFANVDLLVGGSPCQDLSRGGNMAGLAGQKSKLFYEYVRLLNEIKPKFFLLENVRSMTNTTLDIINGVMGCKPDIINSSLVTAQNRTRCYWTNLPIVKIIPNLKIMLKDIWDYSDPWKFMPTYSQANRVENKHGLIRTGYIPCSQHAGPPLPRELVFSIEGQARTVSTTPSQFPWYTDKALSGNVRRTNILECERLQGLPDGHTNVPKVSLNQRFKMVGNGFTIPVIKWAFQGL